MHKVTGDKKPPDHNTIYSPELLFPRRKKCKMIAACTQEKSDFGTELTIMII